ncbi:DinB family protein [Thermodesulfobacteriota bacterium]
MKAIKLLAYTQFLRHSYLDTFSKLPWDEFVKNRNASFDSLRDIFSHCIFVLDIYINHFVQGDTQLPSINFDDFDSIDKVREYMERVESDANQYLSTVTPEELSRAFERKMKDGSVIQVTVEDMLIDYFQEETHHRGEFIAILWQMGIEPPHLGWGKYINK